MQTNGWGVQMPFWRRVMSPTARGIWFFNSNTRANRTKQNLKTKIKNNNKNKKTIIKNWEACFFFVFSGSFLFFAADSFLLFCFSGESVCDYVFVFLLQKYTFFVQADVISTAFVLVQKI
jgi:hypothetical protein